MNPHRVSFLLPMGVTPMFPNPVYHIRNWPVSSSRQTVPYSSNRPSQG